MKNIVVLGSTGNLGLQMLEVLKSYKNAINVFGLSGFKNKKLLDELAQNVFKSSPKSRRPLIAATSAEILTLATHKKADIVINLISGIAGLKPTIAALKAGKIVILANKESLFLTGEKIMKLARLGENLIPLDSEHNAVFEILKYFMPDTSVKEAMRHVRKITLTGTGGAFYGKTAKQLAKVTAKDALQNSLWQMGAKITIESATLINKGLEIIEAHHLFGLTLKNIDVKIDKTANLHAVVHFKNGKMLGYFSPPDMRHYIENALSSALGHLQNPSPGTSAHIREISLREFARLKNPDHKTFPGIKLILSAYTTSTQNKKLRRAFLQKEEKSITDFINNKITFPEIFRGYLR